MLSDHEHDDTQAKPAGSVTGHLDDWEDLAIDYLDGQVDPATKAAIETHLEGCVACASRLGVQQSVCSLFEQTPLEAPPAGLEDQVLGEVLFPRQPARAATPVATSEPSRWSVLWRRNFKAWIPATVAVVALLAAVVSYGLIQGTSSSKSGVTSTAPQATTALAAAGSTATERNGALSPGQDSSAAPLTTTAGATTTAAGVATTATALSGSGPTYNPVSTTAGPTTTASPTTTSAAPFAATHETTQDKNVMVAELKSADAPVYFVFEPTTTFADSGAAEKASGDFAQQITQLTGLEPLEMSLSLQGATFAAYVPRSQASQLVDLLRSVGATLRLTLNLAQAPVDVAQPDSSEQFSDWLRQRAAQIPEMHASRTPQPAVSDWNFTTSTLLPADKSASPPPDWQSPEQAGTHVLIVIYLGV